MIFSMVGLLRIPLHRQKNIFTGCDIIIMPYYIQMNEWPLKHDSFYLQGQMPDTPNIYKGTPDPRFECSSQINQLNEIQTSLKS